MRMKKNQKSKRSRWKRKRLLNQIIGKNGEIIGMRNHLQMKEVGVLRSKWSSHPHCQMNLVFRETKIKMKKKEIKKVRSMMAILMKKRRRMRKNNS